MTYFNVTVTNIKDGRERHVYNYIKYVEFDAACDMAILFFADGYKATYNLNMWRVTVETIHIIK